MGFSEGQIKQLSGKLSAKHVKTRVRENFTLSYIEGWHTISEANRIFGFDAWDRETVMAQCVWEGKQGSRSACSYVARVRITVRAEGAILFREGSGSGTGTGKNPGEAHEHALKEAETDAMKRALSTFGNLFGLALYDKAQNGVRQCRSSLNKKQVKWGVISETGEPLGNCQDPVIFCSKVREQLEGIEDAKSLRAFWARNKGAVEELRKNIPDLKTEKGQHFGGVLKAIYQSRLDKVKSQRTTENSPADQKSLSAEKEDQKAGEPNQKVDPTNGAPVIVNTGNTLFIEKGPRRIRDKNHLRFVASQNCLVCGRNPSQAHHILFAQPRAMSRKVSDEWTVPLCVIHHRNLHDCGGEQKWWAQQNIDPLKEALQLWRQSCGRDQVIAS
jgi:DNA recombination protein Rad52